MVPIQEGAVQLKELSERAGVSTASIKYYLREGLVPAGEAVHATRAQYSDRHVSRPPADPGPAARSWA